MSLFSAREPRPRQATFLLSGAATRDRPRPVSASAVFQVLAEKNGYQPAQIQLQLVKLGVSTAAPKCNLFFTSSSKVDNLVLEMLTQKAGHSYFFYIIIKFHI